MQKSEIFDKVEDCIADFAAGKIVIVADDESRENEGDMIVAAEKITPESVNTMIKLARGLVCVPTTSERLTALGIDDMVRLNRDAKGTAFTVTVDAAKGVTTGISAADRARTIKLMATPSAGPSDFVTPGHVNPLRARPGGVLERAGHTEAAVDVAKLAGLFPCAAICEITNDDGTMARIPDLVKFKKEHNMKLMSVADLIEYRMRRDTLVKIIFERPFPTRFGDFKLVGLRSATGPDTHFALVKGKITEEPTLARVHSENVFADMFADSSFASGSNSFARAMAEVEKAGSGAVIYISRADSGIVTPDGVPELPSRRDYGLGAQILRALGFKKIRLLTTHPGSHALSDGYGLEITEQIQF